MPRIAHVLVDDEGAAAPGDSTERRPVASNSPWSRPHPSNLGSATTRVHTVASPLLAGFAVSLIGIVSASRSAFVAPDALLALGTFGAGALVFAMQLGFWAEQHYLEPSRYVDWHPLAALDPVALYELRREQHNDWRRWDWYRARAGRFYRLGILSLLAAVAVATLPPTMPRFLPRFDLASYLPSVVAVAWLALETSWIVSSWRGAPHWFIASFPEEEPPLTARGFRPRSLS
jgi:hypothetical protein